MKKVLFTLLLSLSFIGMSFASSLYILYDETCMDRLEYIYKNTDDGGEYIVYQVTTNPGEKIILEVGTESTTPQDFLPSQFIRCNNAVFDSKLVNTINSNIDQVFMVVRKGNNRYFVSPINFAARYLRANDYILYDSPKYRFQFDLRNGTIGENIAYKNPDATVNFEGKLDNECTGEYIFRQYSEFAGNPHTDLVLVPELGILEERSGVNAADAITNTLRLNKVNGMPLDRYLRRLCNGKEDPVVPVEPDEFTAKEVPQTGEVPGEYDQSGQPFLGRKPSLPAVGAPPSSASIHTVKKGETLYSISKRYGVSVNQVKSWNNKGRSNTIYPGEELKVSAFAETLTAKGNDNLVREYNVLSDRMPNSANQDVAFGAGNSGSASSATWTGTGRHTVRRGETIASIAMNYGYTEGRFRDINKLGPNEYIKVGQVLKTDDCDCPDAPTPRSSQATGSINQPTTPYYANPGLTPRSPEQISVQEYNNYLPRKQQNTGNEESFSDDGFGSRSTETEYRNTPYFLNRSSQVSEPVAPARSYNSSGFSNRTQQATPQQSEFYTVQPRSSQPQTQNIPSEFYTVQPKSPQAASSNNYRVPNSAMPGYQPSQQPRSYSTTPRSNANKTVYIVKDGDTLYSIARAYGVSIEQLRGLNNLGRGEVLIPYQKIYLN